MKDNTLIVEIKRNALDDGPGIRTLIFFKGCPLSCVWCQNPEAKSSFEEIFFDKACCSGCGKCIEVCEQNAINFEYIYRIDRSICSLCGKCIDKCSNYALKIVGKRYSIEDLLNIILKDKIFYDNSGGGVTFSGGEPLFHIQYVHKLLKELKKFNIHVCIETSGLYNHLEFEPLILPYVDLIFFDLKIYNPMIHTRYCNVSNENILKNFENLIEKSHIEILPRIPLIPGITDTDENLHNLANYLKSLNVKKIGLLPYNPLWLDKSEKIGITSLYLYNQWLSEEDKKRIKKIFSGFDFKDF